MGQTGVPSLDKSLQRTKEWLHAIQAELGWDNEQQVYTATRAVLHAIRDRLTVEEAVQLGEQLPMIMKGFYYESYDPAGKPERYGLEGFYEKVQDKTVNFPIEPEFVSKAVLKVLKAKSHPGGEMEHVWANMPKDLKPLFE